MIILLVLFSTLEKSRDKFLLTRGIRKLFELL